MLTSHRPPRQRGPLLLGILLVLGACSSEPEPHNRVSISVAPLKLDDLTEVEYLLTVTNSQGGIVWTREVSSTRYGDGKGALTYVGPCDADANPNTVSVDILRLIGPDEEPVPATAWSNPSPVRQTITCQENADTAAIFDITVLRDAEQGFFDIAVEFDDVFCSAKLDCQEDLLHRPDGERGPTAVVGFACAAGNGQPTWLYFADDIKLTCGDRTYFIDPTAGPGNLGGDSPAVFQAATYRGREGFPNVDKCFWNTAIGIEPTSTPCTLSARATASSRPFVGGELPPNSVWPEIVWNNIPISGTDTLSCGTHPLGGDGSLVQTSYTRTGQAHFRHELECASGNVATLGSRVCVGEGTPCDLGDPCANGTCSAEGTCTLTSTQPDGQLCTLPGVCDPLGTCVSACAQGACEGARPASVLRSFAVEPETVLTDAVDDSNQHAYLAKGGEGVGVFDLGDPANPVALGTWTAADIDCTELALVRDAPAPVVAAACGQAGVKLIDFSDPGTPVLLATLATTAPATTLTAVGPWLYSGDGDTLNIHDLSNPSNPLAQSPVVIAEADPIVAVRSTPTNVYSLLTSGSVIQSEVSASGQITQRSVLPARANPTGLAVEHDFVFATFDGPGFYVYDFNGTTPVEIYHDGGSRTLHISVSGYRGVIVYADQRVVTLSLRHYHRPKVLTSSVAPAASGVAVLDGLAFLAHGDTFDLLDYLPFVIGSSPVDDSAGLCGDATLELRFSEPIDADCVDNSSLDLTRGSTSIAGLTDQRTPDALTFAPDVAIENGTYKARAQSICDLRDNPGPLVPDDVDFEVDTTCIASDFPNTALSGQPVRFTWTTAATPTSTTLFASTGPQGHSPYSDRFAIPGSPNVSGGHEATWVAPIVTTPTTYWVVASADIGATTRYGEVLPIVVEPDPLSCTDCVPPAATVLDTASRSAGAIRDALEDNDDPNLAYLAVGSDGLEVRDQSDPTNTQVVATWSEVNPDLDCQELVQVGDLLYLACGAAGVKCVSVADPSSPAFIDTLATGPATTIATYGDALYVGVGDRVAVYDIVDPLAPTFTGWLGGSSGQGPSPIVSVVVDGDLIYAFFGDGTLIVSHAATPTAPVYVRTIAPTAPGLTAADLQVVGGLGYLAYQGAGLYIVDLREVFTPGVFTPTTLWHDGGSDIVRVSVAGRTFAVLYADGTGLLANASIPTSPLTLSRSEITGAATGLALLPRWLYSGHGLTLRVVDVPPYVVGSSHRPDTRGVCGDVPLDTYFSAPLDPQTVTADTVSVDTAGSLATSGARVRFTPSTTFAVGDHTTRVTQKDIANSRGTLGPAPDYVSNFEISSLCLDWLAVPDSVLSGTPADLRWAVTGADSTRVHISSWPDPADPYAQTITASGSPDTGAFAATFEAPAVTTPTTFYAVAEARVGNQSYWGPVTTFEVTPALATAQTFANATILDAVDHGDLAYAANGTGLEIHDVSNPASPAVVGFWVDPRGGTCSAIAIDSPYVYLACGASGVYVLDVTTTTPSLAFWIEQPASTLSLYGSTLYIGQGEDIAVWNVGNPTAPLFVRTLDTAANSQLVRVVTQDGVLYAFYANGTLYIADVADAQNPAFVRLLPSLHPGKAGLDLRVVNGVIYLGYRDIGLVAVDAFDILSPTWTPSTLWTLPAPDANSHIVRFDVRDGLVTVVYSNGRFYVGALSSSPGQPPTELVSTPRSGTPSAVTLLASGYVLGAWGNTFSYVDPPLWLLFSSPAAGSSTCGDTEVTLVFSAPVRAASLTDRALRIVRNGSPVEGTFTANGAVVRFVPSAPLSAGLHTVEILAPLENVRGTQASPTSFTFTAGGGCIELTSAPSRVVAGSGARFAWQTTGGTASNERLLIATSPLSAPQYQLSAASPATFATPSVATPTTLYAQVEATVGGATTRSAPTAFVVEPPLSTLSAADNEILSAVAEGEDGLAYLATGIGLSIRDVSNPDQPFELGRWSRADLSTCDTIAIRQSGEPNAQGRRATVVYLGCGADGVLVLDVSDPLSPVYATTLVVDAVSLVTVGDALYLGLADGSVRIYDLTLGLAPVYRTTLTGPGPSLVRVFVDGLVLYVLYADGTVGRYDVSDLFAPTGLTTISAYLSGTAVDFTVVDGIAYVAYSNGQITIIDVRGPTLIGTVLPPPGAGALVGVSYRNGILACVYAGGGFATVNVIDPAHPVLIGYTAGSETPTLVYIFRSGYAFWSTGTSIQIVDLPPVLTHTFPDGASGCPTAPMYLRFSQQLEASSINSSTVRATRDGLPVSFVRSLDPTTLDTLILTPQGPLSGTVVVTIQGVSNRRGTTMVQAETRTFTYASVCLTWQSAPVGTASGLTSNLSFASSQAVTSPELLIGPLDAPSSTWTAYPATTAGVTHTVAFTAPTVSIPTRYGAVPRVTVNGSPTVGGFIHFVILPEPCALTPQCDDGNACTDEQCTPYVGCVVVPDDTNGCDDDNACTSGDYCQAGACRAASTTTCTAATCEVSSCDAQTGQCVTTVASDGALCDDSDPGTSASVCQAGNCEEVPEGTTLTTITVTQTPTQVIRRMVQVGVYGYAVLEPGGLVILNLSNPSSPVPVGSWSVPGRDACVDVTVVEGRAYLLCSGELFTLDVSSSTQPVFVDSTPVTGASTIVYEGGTLYIGTPSGLVVYQLGINGRPTLSGTIVFGDGPLVRVWYQDGLLYTASASGIVRVFDASGGSLTTRYVWDTTTWVDGTWTVTDFVVIGGYLYLSYAGGGVYAFDTSSPNVPSLAWWTGPGNVTSLGYANGILVYGYANGGFVTASVVDPSHPISLAWTFESGPISAATVIVSPSGEAVPFSASGPSISTHDVPPYVAAITPSPGSTGLCAQGQVVLWFSTTLDPSSVTATSVIVETLDGSPIPGTRVVDNHRVTFTPTTPFAAGDYRVRVTDQLENVRSTPFSAEGYSSTFSVALACVQWTAAPSGIVKGLTGTFSFNVVGATPTTTELLFTTHPDVNAPIANPTAVLATPDGPGYSAAWTAPVLARNTTYYATPRVTLGVSAILGPTVAFLVVAEGCFCSAGERCESGLCVPEPECDPGYGNCDAYNTNGCETPIDVDDVNHCGGCHVRCGGGVCEDGECLPTTLVSAAGSEVFGLAVDTTHIYWAARSSQQLRRSLKDGTGEELLASGYYVTDVAVDDTYVYFTTYTSQTLHRVPKGGGAVTLLAHSQPFPIGLAKRGHDLYYTSGSNGGLRRLSLLNGTTSQVAAMPDSHLGGLAIEGDSFFSVGSAGAVYQTDTTTEILASPGSGLSLADADTRYVYFGGSSRLGRVNRETGVIETFSTSGNTYGVAVDDRFIYWTNATSATINRIAKPLETDLGTNLLCRTDHANCNDDPADDCETDIDNDPDHCGVCGNSCGAGEVCVAGTCGPIQCPPGFDDCDGDPDNGCEVDLVRDADHCGACNNGCDSGFCRDLQCVPDVVSHSCLGHQNLGLTSSGHYLVDPDGNGPAPTSAVYCDQDTDGGGWMVVARASDTNGYPGDYEFRAAAGARSLLDVDSTVGTSDAAQFGIALDDLWADSATPLALQAFCYDSRLPSSTSYWARVLSLDYAPLATALDTTNPQTAFTNLKAINQDGDTTDYGRLDLMARGTVGYSACGNGSAGQVGVKLSCQQGQQPMFPPGVWMLTDYNQPQYTEVTSCGPVGGNALPYYRGEIRLREHPCTDGFANADETDVDCGGPVCARCTTNDICLVASDCDSRVCTSGICRAPTCSDFVQNGTETGIDCGGSCGTLCNGVTWQNPVGVVEVYTAEGAGLDRTNPGSGWDAGASSVQTVAGNGFVSFVATEVNRYRMIGLSNGDSDAGYGDIDFAWYLHTGSGLYIYEQGSQIGSFGSYATGDTFRVEVFDNQVRYVHNGVVRHSSTRTPTFPLRVDTSLYDQGATLRGVLLTSCATIPDDPICVFGQTWRSTANISGDGDSLVRSNTAQGWTSGASSADYFTCGYGAMTVTATERTTERVAGLGDLDSSVSNTDVDYGIHFRADGTLGVLENGTIRGSFGTYQTGDVFRVEMALPTVTYKKNGAVFYTSTVPASELGTWVLDTAFYTPNATLDGLQLIDLSPTGDPTCGGAAFWKNYNSVVRGNGAKKATGAVTWDQGASTVEAITSGDGFAEMTVAESNTSMMVGLGDLDNTRSYTDIDFATYLSATTIYVYESGSSRGTFGNYKSGDRMRVEVDNGQVLYRRNGVHYYTSSLPPIYPLALDISFYSVDATVNDVDVHTCGVDDALCNPTHDWRNGNYLTSEGLSLWRDIGGNSWNSGAATQKTITCGQGRVSAVVANITDAAFGLGSVDTNQSHTDIEYAFMLVSNGQLLIYESGTQVAVVGNYTLGDELTVEIDIEAAGGPVVQYLQNDVLVYTSNRAPMLIENFQLDTAFFRANSRFDGLVITDDDGGLDPACGGSSFWANPVNVATRGTSLRREDGGNNYQAGAVSQASFTGDGYMEFTVPTNTYTLAVGLSSTNVNTDYTDLEYGIYFAGSTLYIYESGSSPGSFGTFEPGGRFRIESIGGKVRYLRDGVIFHTSSVAPTGPLFVDTSMYSNLSTATDFVITACTPEDESCARPIDWYNGRYLRAFDEGRTLRADPGANGWVAGAATTGFITCGHGSVSAIATETNKDRVFGLGIGNTNVSYSDIEYGLYLTSSGTLQVTESGTTRGTFGTYSTGDVLSVEVDVPTVVYKKNGATLYTSTVPASVGEDYRLDTSFYSGNSSLAGLTVNDLESTDPTCGASAFWTEVVNAVPKSNNLRKDYTVAGYNAGAVSVQTLSGDGFAEFTIPDTAYTLAVGLSNGNTDAYYNDIDFNIYFAGSGLHIYEGTTHRGSFSDYPSGSRFRVEVVDGVVRYLRNGVGMYKSLLNPTFPLSLDTSLYSEGARVRDVVIADCDGTCAPAIRWQNGRRVSAPVNSTLVRDDGNSWTAGASSEGTLKCGRGLARTVVTENNTERMFGLGINDSTPSYSDIDYAFYLVPNGALSVYESGVLRGNFGTYAPGDVLEVEVDQTVVRYKKNGTTVYTSGVTADPVEGYRLDTALYTAGSRLTGLELVDVDAATESTCGGAALWQSLTAASIKGTSLRKTGTTGWNSGAVTANSFVGDGYVTFKAGETSSQVAAGLGTASVANDLYTIPFAFGLIGGTVQIYETGTFRGSFGSYQVGDTFRVERIGSTIRYLRNGVGLYTSTLTSNPADVLRGQVALYTINASVRALSINSCSGDDSCTPALRWQNGRGVSGDETSLRRDATGSDWASGAISEQAIDCQEGSVETTITSLTGQRVFGLGRGDDHRSYSDIDYGYWIQNNTLTIYENGNSRGTFGTLALGDILEVDVSGTTVGYYRTPPGGSRTLIYTSTEAVSPLDTLRLDTSFGELNSGLSELYLDDLGEPDPTCGGDAFWKSQNTTVKWNHILKDSGVNGLWDRGASTQAQITSGDGYLEFTPGETNTTRIIGLGRSDDNDTQADIDFAIQLNNNAQAVVLESGTQKATLGAYSASDRFSIRVLNGQVTYLKNGFVLYNSLLAPVYPLEGDVSLYTSNSRIMDVDLVVIDPGLCGNGNIDIGETCDDGDNSPGDGCAANCQIEPNYACIGTPSVCTPYGVLRSCRAHLVAGSTTSGVYTIDPDGGGPNPSFQVWCDQTTDGGGWTVFQRRVSASDFYRFYADYAAGFGDPATNYWMGNNRLADFTTRFASELRVDFTYSSTAYHAKYTSFAISGAADGYRLAVSGYSGNAGDSLGPQNNYRFTTRDVDQDGSGGNCANDYLSAWWYTSCHSSNLNGVWGSTAYGQGLNWYSVTGYYASATLTEMKVREPIGDLGCDGVSGSGRTIDACGVCGDGSSCGAPALPTSGLTTWLRAHDLSAQASGTPVASWSAAPGTSITATQATTTRQPQFIPSGPNGKPTVRFDGGDRLDLSTNTVAAHPRTIFAVVSTTTSNAHLVGTGSSSAGFLTTYGSGLMLSSGRPAAKANNNSSGILMTAATAINDGNPRVVSAVVATGSGQLLVGADVVATSTATANPWAYTRATLGASDGSATNAVIDPLTGDISEVLIYDRTLSASEQEAVRNYLTAKYIPANKLLDMQFEGSFASTGSLTVATVGSPTLQSTGGAKSDGFANGFVLGSSYLDIEDIYVGGTGSHTFSAWYRGTQSNAVGNVWQPGVVIFGDPANSVYLGLGIDGGRISVANAGQYRGTRRVDDGQWHHLAWVRRGNTWSGYVDGVLDLASATTLDGTSFHYIRAVGTGYPYANVVGPTALDRLAIFDRALTEAEIRILARTAIFESTGAAQTFVVPTGVSAIDTKVWGAGGSGAVINGGGLGGGGAFVLSTLFVIPGELLTLVVGSGGGLKSQDTMHGGGGGGLSGLFRAGYSQANALVVAGGGGGAVHCASGGAGGGPGGTAGQTCYSYTGFGGGGGTQSAGGAAGSHITNTAPMAGSALLGGNGGDPEHSGTSPAAYGGGASGGIGGGGGGGFFGGGGGGHHSAVTGGGGGGGASFSLDTSALFGAGSAATPGGTNDADYNGTAGRGGSGPEAGRPGRVVIRW